MEGGMLRTLDMEEGMPLATALKQVDLHKLIMEWWDLDLLPTPPQVVLGSLGQLDQLGQGKQDKQLGRLHLNVLPAQMLLWNVQGESGNSLECTKTRNGVVVPG